MDPVLKYASDTLLQVADAIEKEAADRSIFACDKCDNTISLSGINSAIRTASEGAGVDAHTILVDDKVACTTCEAGVMSYQASEESDKYYEEESKEEEPEEEAEESNDDPKEDAVSKLASDVGIDINKLSKYI
jgi:hypothetical protein